MVSLLFLFVNKIFKFTRIKQTYLFQIGNYVINSVITKVNRNYSYSSNSVFVKPSTRLESHFMEWTIDGGSYFVLVD